MAELNSVLISDIWLNAGNDYQQRVPNPTQSSVDATMNCLLDPMNGDLYNQFMNSFVNRIGMVRVHGRRWDNPLAVFKGNRLNYGSSVEEAAVQWIKAHSYTDDAQDLLRLERPDGQTWFHTLNRQDKYPISVTRSELRQAFVNEYGLNSLINKIMDTPINADNYDEYLLMRQLFAIYNEKWGFFKHHLDSVPVDSDSGKAFLRALRAYAGKLRFPSTRYNSTITDIPVFADANELVLFVTPEVLASVDVDTLSAVFNLDKAQVKYRTVVIDEFPMENVVALLTTEDFFVCHDVEYQTGSFYDPNTLGTKYILHHWEIVSCSPFVPAILFTTEEGTDSTYVTETPTALSIEAPVDEIPPGGRVQLTVKLDGSLTMEDGTDYDGHAIRVEPQAATYSVTATQDGETIKLNSRTYVDKYGVLRLQKSGIKAGAEVKVTATSTYTNPSGPTDTYTADITFTVVDDTDLIKPFSQLSIGDGEADGTVEPVSDAPAGQTSDDTTEDDGE